MTIPFGKLDLSHHAYALIGGAEAREELVKKLSKDKKIDIAGNPDFFDRSYETFSIDDAREIKSLAETRPVSETGEKTFVLVMNAITVEAQNALLKLLEEPGDYARFFLIIPSAHILIPTVKSRLNVIGASSSGEEEDSDVSRTAKTFISAPVAKRLDMVKSLMDDISKEKKTKQDAIDFIGAVERELYASGIKKNAKGLDSILLAGKYATDRAPSLKMLLEYVALNL